MQTEEIMTPPQENLIEELVLSATSSDKKTTSPKKVKPNSKDDKIDRILEISRKYNFDSEARSTLKRKTKQALNEQLTDLVERALKQDLGVKNGVAPSEQTTQQNIIVLRMINSVLCSTISKGGNFVLDMAGTGYEICNFEQKIGKQQPLIDSALGEILQEHPHMLDSLSNPWIKLGLVYAGCITQSVRKKEPKKILRFNKDAPNFQSTLSV